MDSSARGVQMSVLEIRSVKVVWIKVVNNTSGGSNSRNVSDNSERFLFMCYHKS